MGTHEQIEAIEARLARLMEKAETGADWAEICRIEAEDLKPLLIASIRPRYDAAGRSVYAIG